ncbi:MAG: hypothetical protein FJX86_05275 [Bacteroidetes bacterium]|nr:hypothetical protein [Bacteroidota bacterium]
MAIGVWFSYDKTDNVISIHLSDFIFVIPFLRNKNFLVKELVTIVGNNEISLLPYDEPPCWIKNKHHIELGSILEENFHKPIHIATIELEGGGFIHFILGQLYVKYPTNVSLEKDTISLLLALGYFSAPLIWDFCSKNPEEILLDLILCKEEKDITDEFERMLEHSKEIELERIKLGES